MPTPALWHEKAQLAGQAARQSLDSDNLPAAANRAYFSLHAFLTGRLLELGQQPPARYENWAHAQLGELTRTHIRTPDRFAIRSLLQDLRQMRVLADYDNHRRIPKDQLGDLLRSLDQVIGSRER